MAGGVIRSVPSEPTPEFFHALERAIIHSIPKPIAVVVCYPSNPTAHVADLDFYKDLVAFAKKHGIFILSDLAYAEVYFDDNPPPSVLQVPGAIDVDGRVHLDVEDLSRCPAGAWALRSATSASSRRSARVKSYLDYGAFTPVQVAATAALNGPDDCITRDARDLQAAAATCWSKASAAPAGRCRRRRASMFAWAPIPEPFRELGSVEFSKLLVEKAEVAVSPGIGFGEHGEGFVRIALVENEQRIRQAARNIRRFLETGAGKVAQRRSRSRRGADASISSIRGRFMATPLKVGLAGLGTVGASVVRADRAAARSAGRALRPADRGRRGQRALARQEPRRRSARSSAGSTIRSRLRATPASTCSSN